MLPKVSILWLHYNSMHVIDLSKRSLDALAKLDYPNFELITVDNSSTDGSGEIIEQYIKEKKFRMKFLRTKSNLGWSGGINFAYRARGPDSEYVALTQNDLIAKSDYLTQLIGYMQVHSNVGAVQGIVADLNDTSVIDSSGLMADEALSVTSIFRGKPVSVFNKPTYVSYVEGTMPIYRISAIKQVLGDNHTLFITSGFIYFLEDVFVSLMLWQNNWKCIVLPIIAGAHSRKATSERVFVSLRLAYFDLRNHLALLYMTNSCSKIAYFLKTIRKLLLSGRTLAQRQMMAESLINGIRIGRQLKKKYGTINLYAAPLLKINFRKRFEI